MPPKKRPPAAAPGAVTTRRRAAGSSLTSTSAEHSAEQSDTYESPGGEEEGEPTAAADAPVASAEANLAGSGSLPQQNEPQPQPHPQPPHGQGPPADQQMQSHDTAREQSLQPGGATSEMRGEGNEQEMAAAAAAAASGEAVPAQSHSSSQAVSTSHSTQPTTAPQTDAKKGAVTSETKSNDSGDEDTKHAAADSEPPSLPAGTSGSGVDTASTPLFIFGRHRRGLSGWAAEQGEQQQQQQQQQRAGHPNSSNSAHPPSDGTSTHAMDGQSQEHPSPSAGSEQRQPAPFGQPHQPSDAMSDEYSRQGGGDAYELAAQEQAQQQRASGARARFLKTPQLQQQQQMQGQGGYGGVAPPSRAPRHAGAQGLGGSFQQPPQPHSAIPPQGQVSSDPLSKSIQDLLDTSPMFQEWIDPTTGGLYESFAQALMQYDPHTNYFSFDWNRQPGSTQEFVETQQQMLAEIDQTTTQLQQSTADELADLQARMLQEQATAVGEFKMRINTRVQAIHEQDAKNQQALAEIEDTQNSLNMLNINSSCASVSMGTES